VEKPSRSTGPRISGHPTVKTAIWLVQLRWIAVVGQCIAVGISYFGLGIRFPVTPVISLIFVTAFSNLGSMVVVRRIHRRYANSSEQGSNGHARTAPVNSSFLGLLLLLDILTLTGLLYFTGGVMNPFSCFFLANIVVVGLILSPYWTWALTAVTVVCTIFLLGYSKPLPALVLDQSEKSAFYTVPTQGLLIALTTCSIVVAYFMTVLVRELRRSENRLVEAEEQRESAQRLEALATLAAGAGHELASPLSTIAVVAKELSRKLERIDATASIRRDVELIRSELDRCREVLQRMKSGAGEAAAEKMHDVSVTELVSMVLTPMREPDRVEVVIEPAIRQESIQIPLQAVTQALRNLVQNALDASEPTAKVAMHLERQEKSWMITIIDRGSGMGEDVLRRIGQPFFTTKDVGQGMGLGVFLTRNVLAGLGGSLEFESQPGKGTSCRVILPN